MPIQSALYHCSLVRGSHISRKSLVKDGSNQSTVNDPIVTTQSSTHVYDRYKGSAQHHTRFLDNIPTASDSSCLAKRIGGIASLPGPLSDPAVSELWILLGSYCWYGPGSSATSFQDIRRLTGLVPSL